MRTRIHIIGGSGVGKTTLASRLGVLLNAPVFHLDEIARIGGGHGPLRPDDERDKLLGAILDEPQWITEGVHLGWTDPLLRESDLIVWIDGVPVNAARQRIAKRFFRDALAEARRRRGRDRILRFRDYGAELRGLVTHLISLHATSPGVLEEANEVRYSTTLEAALRPFAERVVRLENEASTDALINRLTSMNRVTAHE